MERLAATKDHRHAAPTGTKLQGSAEVEASRGPVPGGLAWLTPQCRPHTRPDPAAGEPPAPPRHPVATVSLATTARVALPLPRRSLVCADSVKTWVTGEKVSRLCLYWRKKKKKKPKQTSNREDGFRCTASKGENKGSAPGQSRILLQ